MNNTTLKTTLDNPKVAVLLAAYNGEKFIIEQLESIRNQTYQNFRCYIHDDGSTDGTYDLLADYCERNPDKFKLVEGPSCGGAKNNFFFLMRAVVDEPYIMFCDQDDYWQPEKISSSLKAIRELSCDSAEPLCVYSDLEVVNSDLELINSSFYHFTGRNPLKNDLKSLLITNEVVGCTMMINRALAEKSLEINDIGSVFMHDWWIALVASACGKINFIDRPLMKYRQHQHNVVGAVMKKNIFARTIQYCSPENIEKKRKAIRRCYSFAAALDAILPDDHADKRLITETAVVRNEKWPARALFFLRNGLIGFNKFWNLFFI